MFDQINLPIRSPLILSLSPPPPSSCNFMWFTLNPLCLLCAAWMCTGVEPSTGAGIASQVEHPCQEMTLPLPAANQGPPI